MPSASVDSSQHAALAIAGHVDRVIVLTPMMGGADGISEMTRQWVHVLETRVGREVGEVEIWSLGDHQRPGTIASATSFRPARGSRVHFASLAAGGGFASASNTLVVVMHLQLLPVTLPLVWRGARLLTVLMGIESWTRLRPLERSALRRAWKVIAISRETAGRFRAANPSLADLPITVCHPGAPTMAMPASERINGQFGLIVGRMNSEERYKGHDVLLEVWPAVRKAIPDARLIVAGDGDDAGRLRNKASEGITFVGRVSGERLATLYRDATFFVMPSTDEGFGLVYLEAMRSATPCIAARGAAEEIITDGREGLIVDAGDRNSLIDSMVRLFADHATRATLGSAAARRVAEEFSPIALERRVCDALGLGTP